MVDLIQLSFFNLQHLHSSHINWHNFLGYPLCFNYHFFAIHCCLFVYIFSSRHVEQLEPGGIQECNLSLRLRFQLEAQITR